MLRLHDFLGDWRIRRRIDDARAGQAARFDGLARLVPDGRGLRWREEGTLTLAAGSPLAATREYLWDRDGAGILVRFADGRAFHRFVPTGRADGTDHPCGADLYRVAYDFTGWPLWSATWRVAGPGKDYVMRSDHARP